MKPVSKQLYDGYQFQLRGKWDDAARLYRKILRAEPKNADVMILLGIVRDKQMKHADAVELFDRAIKIKPDLPQAHHNRGVALAKLDQYIEAAASFLRGFELRPEIPEALSEYASMKRRMCDWDNYDWLTRELMDIVRGNRAVVNPFIFMQFSDDPAYHLSCAQLYMSRHLQSDAAPPQPQRAIRAAGNKIRLAYLSADFREHPVGHTLAGLIERHDRSRFEVTAISTGRNDKGIYRQRYEKAFDRFLDAVSWSDEEIAHRVAPLGLEVLVDLMGHTDGARYRFLAGCPAPVQVNFIGYPGTIGADFVDYILVDPFIVPSEQQQFFSEKLVHLPDCYLANDPKRTISERTPSLVECGLPEQGFVFCCFNNYVKLTPMIFDIWTRLLQKVPGSVLWMSKSREEVEQNLRREAEARGVDPVRLIFAPRVSIADHLARHRIADLFLDTLPYNAHTTASDALWTGLPLVTCPGRSFQSRVAGSLLHAMRLPELICGNLEEYEALALRLATNPELLRKLRARAERNRLTTPLFDLDRYRRHLEAAFETMMDIWRRGEAPRAFAVEPIKP
jgi:predicted O-linked N-acetylglucosamine transferase (SPINDLY family)